MRIHSDYLGIDHEGLCDEFGDSLGELTRSQDMWRLDCYFDAYDDDDTSYFDNRDAALEALEYRYTQRSGF